MRYRFVRNHFRHHRVFMYRITMYGYDGETTFTANEINATNRLEIFFGKKKRVVMVIGGLFEDDLWA